MCPRHDRQPLASLQSHARVSLAGTCTISLSDHVKSLQRVTQHPAVVHHGRAGAYCATAAACCILASQARVSLNPLDDSHHSDLAPLVSHCVSRRRAPPIALAQWTPPQSLSHAPIHARRLARSTTADDSQRAAQHRRLWFTPCHPPPLLTPPLSPPSSPTLPNRRRQHVSLLRNPYCQPYACA